MKRTLILFFALAGLLLAQVGPTTPIAVPRLRVGNPTGGTPSAGVINAEGIKINGVDVGTSSSSYWNASAPGINYTAGPVSLNGVPTGDAGDFQAEDLTLTGNLLNFSGSAAAVTMSGAGTTQKYVRMNSTGGDLYLGIESSVAGAFFTSAAAYESVFYSPNNNSYFRTPKARFSGYLTLDTNTSFASLSATGASVHAQTAWGGVLAGYGTTNDVSIFNRAGSLALSVPANTTNVGIAGLLLLADGTTAAPSLAFTADTNTGIARAATDTLEITAGGTRSTVFTSTTVTMSGKLAVQGATSLFGTTTDNGADSIQTRLSASTETGGIATYNVYPGGYGAALNYYGTRGDGTTFVKSAMIQTVGAANWADAANTTASLVFHTVSANTLAERLRLTSTGTTVAGNLTVSGAGTSTIASGSLTVGTGSLSGSEKVNITRSGTGNSLILSSGTVTGAFYHDASAMWYGTSSAHPLYFYTGGGSQSLTLSTAGLLTLGAGSGTRGVIINGDGSTSGQGAYLQFMYASSNAGYIGRASYVTSGGRNTNDLAYAAGTSLGHYFYANNTTQTATMTSSGVAILGTTTNDNASTGWVGEYVSSTVGSGSAVALTTVTGANITSISLTAGDWDVFGNIAWSPAGGTTVTFAAGGATTTSATSPQEENRSQVYALSNAGVTMIAFPTTRFSVASTTTVYLTAYASFSGSTLSAYGSIRARRVR